MRRRALLAASQSANTGGAWENEYFTIESLQDGTTFSIKSQINYSLNRGSWVTASANTNIRLSSNDRVRISTRLSPVTSERDRALSISGSFNVSGNIMSLLYGDDFIGQTKISNNYALAYLFYNCTGLVSAENLILPATTLTGYCYRSMFEGCTNMTKAPLLPATSVPNYGYMRLFYGCSKINYIKMLANNANIYTLSQWVYGVSSTGIFVKHPEATWDVRGVNGVPEGWTIKFDGEQEGGGEITFYIEDGMYVTVMKASSNMTWEDFINSEYSSQANYLQDFMTYNMGAYDAVKFYHVLADCDMNLYSDSYRQIHCKSTDIIQKGQTYNAG